MAENRNQENRDAPSQKQGGSWDREHAKPDSPKPEQHSKPAKHAFEERERERASQADKSHQDNARGDRNPGNFQNDRERASQAGRKGGER
jgi:general stress protein YciG